MFVALSVSGFSFDFCLYKAYSGQSSRPKHLCGQGDSALACWLGKAFCVLKLLVHGAALQGPFGGCKVRRIMDMLIKSDLHKLLTWCTAIHTQFT